MYISSMYINYHYYLINKLIIIIRIGQELQIKVNHEFVYHKWVKNNRSLFSQLAVSNLITQCTYN